MRFFCELGEMLHLSSRGRIGKSVFLKRIPVVVKISFVHAIAKIKLHEKKENVSTILHILFEIEHHLHPIPLDEPMHVLPNLLYHARSIPPAHIRPRLGNRTRIAICLHKHVARVQSRRDDLDEELAGLSFGNGPGADDEGRAWRCEFNGFLHSAGMERWS